MSFTGTKEEKYAELHKCLMVSGHYPPQPAKRQFHLHATGSQGENEVLAAALEQNIEVLISLFSDSVSETNHFVYNMLILKYSQ